MHCNTQIEENRKCWMSINQSKKKKKKKSNVGMCLNRDERRVSAEKCIFILGYLTIS